MVERNPTTVPVRRLIGQHPLAGPLRSLARMERVLARQLPQWFPERVRVAAVQKDTLILVAPSGGHALQPRFGHQLILRILQDQLGRRDIRRLHIRIDPGDGPHSPRPHPPSRPRRPNPQVTHVMATAAEDLADPALRAAWMRLCRSLARHDDVEFERWDGPRTPPDRSDQRSR